MPIVTPKTDFVAARIPEWQAELKAAIRDPRELGRVLGLPDEFAELGREAIRQFPLFAPRPFVGRIERFNPRDPLLLQLLPTRHENDSNHLFKRDPVSDQAATLAPGVIKKYTGRALLIATGACAIHCRYCFRRHFPYDSSPQGTIQWQNSLAAIRDDTSIHEVILSGGDPLMLNDENLQRLLKLVSEINHVQRLRIHTRLPIMIPSRVTPILIDSIRSIRPVVNIVIHCNHAREIDVDVENAISRLVDHGIPVLNQSVLLRGINDDLHTLVGLSNRLINLRVLPYYLHQLDRVEGAAHFEVPVEVGKQLVGDMRKLVPGYAVPRYVAEVAGECSKSILA